MKYFAFNLNDKKENVICIDRLKTRCPQIQFRDHINWHSYFHFSVDNIIYIIQYCENKVLVNNRFYTVNHD